MNHDSTGAPSTADPRVDAVVRECQGLRDAMARGRWIRALISLATLAFLVGFGMAYYNKAKQLSSKEYVDRLASVAQARLESSSADYMKEVERLISTSSPVLTEAFYERAKQDLPHYMKALGEEKTVLVDRLQANVEKKLQETQSKVLERYQGMLKEEFPDFTEEQYGRMINNLEVAVQDLSKKFYRDELEAELNKLYDAWDLFPKTDSNTDPNVRIEDQFIAALVDLLQHKLTELDRPGTTSASL